MSRTTTQERDTTAETTALHPAAPDTAEAPELAAARDLRDALAALVLEHVRAGRVSPHAAGEACKALAAEAVAELAGGDEVAWCVAGRTLERFGRELRDLFAARLAGDAPSRPIDNDTN